MRDWQRNQLINFSHNNQQFLKATPRLAREVIGRSLPTEIHTDVDVIVFAGACALLGGLLAALYL